MPHAHSLETLIEASPSGATITFPGNLGTAGTFAATGASSTGALTAASLTVTAAATIGTNVTITGPGIVTSSVPSADHATTVDLFEIAATNPINTTGTNTLNFLTIDAAIGNSSGGTNACVGLQIDAITGDAQVTETAINIGSGWDSGITTASPVTLSDVNIVLGTSTGTKIGTATTQKLGFWNATPVVQQSHIADPSGGATQDAEARTAIAAINALCATLGLTASV